MVAKNFYLPGKDPSVPENVHLVEIDITHDFDAAQSHVADAFSIVDPSGVGFQTAGAQSLPDLDSLLDAEQPIAVTVDGHEVRQVPGPKGLPVVGTYYEVFPDHIGNNQRLFERFGPVIQHTDLGRNVFLTNDPAVTLHVFQESLFWTKHITASHPLNGAKDNAAGLFIGDTDSRAWRLAHKFLPPSLSPRAVRKYTPLTQETAEESFKIFDQFAEENEAFDVFNYMFKLTSQAVSKVVLDVNPHHFDTPDAPLAKYVTNLLEFFSLFKKVSDKGSWYSHLPFGDPKRLRDKQAEFSATCVEAIKQAQSKGGPDLPIATAALEATSIADFAARAVDEEGNKMPDDVIAGAVPILIAAGFLTTASLMSWMVHVAATHPELQEKVVQELIDHDVTGETRWDFDSSSDLPYLDKFLKETQRLYNPAFQPARTALRDQIIPGGFEIKKGTVMICSLHALHRNPAVWDDPGTFNPDRWDTEKVRKRPSGSYVPFALGPRSCIGFNFALSEAKTMFATLVYRYKFVKYGDMPPDYSKDTVVFQPSGLYAQVERRTSWPAKSK